MARDYQATKARKLNRLAKANAQNIANMFARAAAPQQQAAPAAAAAGGGDEEEPMEEEQLDEANNNANDNNDNGGDSNGGDGGGGGDGGSDESDVDDDGKKERWQPFAKQWFKRVKNEIATAVDMRGRESNRRRMGKWPDKYKGRVSPSEDTLSFFDGEKLTMDHFALPDLHVWWMEAQYPWFFPQGRPRCKWHKSYNCCVSKGWMEYPRRAWSQERTVAVLGRIYECSTRKQAGMEQYKFRSIDEEVINDSDDYIILQWKKAGYVFSHRGGMLMRDLAFNRRCLIQGLSVAGYRNAAVQSAKQYHLILSAQYRSWSQGLGAGNLLYPPNEIRELQGRPFYEFDSDMYGQYTPSNSYLIEQLIQLMEKDNKYKERRMQMLDGLHLKGDHSFKITKCCVTRGKPFTAVYCLLNEFCQVVAWWLTTGTSMGELEEPLRMLKNRYTIHGFDGPHSATTDRCCQERGFWNNIFCGMNDDDGTESHILPGDTTEVEVVQPLYNARVAYTSDITIILVGEISSYLSAQPSERQVIIVDGEWRIGNTKMDVLIIGLLSGQVFIFHLTSICRHGAAFPLVLKTLLEDSNVRKVGNRIKQADVKKLEGWGVEMKSVVELGHLTQARGLSPTKAPSLESICNKLYPGVVMEGKDTSNGPTPRISNWGNAPLSTDQLAYANCDGYTTVVLYKRTMQFMDPRAEGKIRRREVDVGSEVVLYLPGLKMRVGRGIIRGTRDNNKYVIVEIDLDAADCKSAMVHVVNEDDSIETETKSILSLRSALSDGDSSVVRIRWELIYCRRRRDPVGDNNPVEISTYTKQVVIENDEGEDEELRAQNYDGDNEANDGYESGSSSSDGENDVRTRLPRNLRRRLHRFRKERVKNDVEHIFLRFQKVLSKEHGAYYSFITSLRDALFVLNDDDLEDCLEVLREKRGLSDEKIAKMMAYDFSWFLRRVRRLIPSPPDLEKRYLAVYQAHKDIICQKSGKTLFDSVAANSQHKSMLKHIRRNCLSDIPFVTYYTPINTDRHGLTRWRCHRGTNGNEGLHQKLRQLVRGYSNSPRLLYALITEYLLQWNQNIDVKVRGLPSKYYGLHDGELLEAEIEKLAKTLDEPPHPQWIPTSSVQDTGESFGIINSSAVPSSTPANNDLADDAVLDMLAEEAADNLSDIEADGGVDDNVVVRMTASSQWMANLNGRIRPFDQMRSPDEWDYFVANFLDFQGNSGGEADNHSNMRWSAFADAWNEMVDNLGRSKPSITYKSASHLQQAFKSMKRRQLQQATLRPHAQRLRELRDEHTNAENRTHYVAQFAAAEPATTSQPFADAMETEEQEGATYDADDEQAATNGDNREVDDEVQQNNEATPKRRTNNHHRCRKCGKEYTHVDWAPYHEVPTRVGICGGMLKDNSKKVWDVCTVPEEDWEVDFPCLDLTKPMPRRKKPRRRRNN